MLSNAGMWHLDLVCALAAGLAAYNTAALGLQSPSSVQQEQLESLREAAASLLANTAGCLAQSWLLSRQAPEGAAQPATCTSVSGSPVALLMQQQQHLTAAVQQFVAWPNLQRYRPQPAALTPSSCSSMCEVSTITQLAQKLQAAALSVSSALTAVDVGGNCLDINVGASLWLQAVTCRCAAALRTLPSSSSGRSADRDDAAAAAAAAAATAHVLQAVRPYLSLACKWVKLEEATAAAPEAGQSSDAGGLLAGVRQQQCIHHTLCKPAGHADATRHAPSKPLAECSVPGPAA